MKKDLYMMNVNRRRNCYSFRRFGYLVRNCTNQKIVGQEKRVEYKDNLNTRDNLKEKMSLVVFN